MSDTDETTVDAEHTSGLVEARPPAMAAPLPMQVTHVRIGGNAGVRVRQSGSVDVVRIDGNRDPLDATSVRVSWTKLDALRQLLAADNLHQLEAIELANQVAELFADELAGA